MTALAARVRADPCSAWPIGVVRADARGAVSSVNPAAIELLARLPGGAESRDLFRMLAPLSGLRAAAARQSADSVPLRRRLCAPDGTRVGLTLLREPDRSLVALLVDETALARAEDEAHRQRARFAALADSAAPGRVAVFTLDAAGVVSGWSRSAEIFEGLAASEAAGLSLDALFDRAAFRADPGLLLAEAARGGVAAASGHRFAWNAAPGRATLTLRAVRAVDGTLDGFVAEWRAEDAETPREVELRRLADADPLTGVLNRRALFGAGAAALDALRARGATLSLIVLDLDRFKALNDRSGHAAGDAALRALAEAAREAVRAGDLVGRIGGDEFALALPRLRLDSAAQIAERLRARVEALRVETEGATIRFTASFGVAEASGDEPFARTLERADAALYRAKAAGRNLVARA